MSRTHTHPGRGETRLRRRARPQADLAFLDRPPASGTIHFHPAVRTAAEVVRDRTGQPHSIGVGLVSSTGSTARAV